MELHVASIQEWEIISATVLRTFSEETMRAINHATRQGVICISAAGNLGTETLVYPAALANVTGVAAVTEDQELSSVSNYGEDLVSLATLC